MQEVMMMCDKSAYRTPDELWDASPMNPKNRKKDDIKAREHKSKTGIDFLNDHIR